MGSMSNTLREMNDTIWGLPHAGLFCVANAAMYVGVMYVIPKSVRSLPRDHVRHVSSIASCFKSRKDRTINMPHYIVYITDEVQNVCCGHRDNSVFVVLCVAGPNAPAGCECANGLGLSVPLLLGVATHYSFTDGGILSR